jgi:dipeptidyl aminopeptidase/acylaminoacyl peptidase
VPVTGIVGLAPVGDLVAAHRTPHLTRPVEAFVGGSPTDLPDRYEAASPVAHLPLGVPSIIIHGDRDEQVPVALSRSFAGAAADAGDPVVYHEVEGAVHTDLIDPSSVAWRIVLGELDRLSW